MEKSICSNPGGEAIRVPPSTISPISGDPDMRETITPAAVHRDLTTTLVSLFRCQRNCQDRTGRKQFIHRENGRASKSERTLMMRFHPLKSEA